MNKLPISVIVCAKNSEATINDCLKSIKDNHPAEIIVVDGNSIDQTREIAQRYTDKIYTLGKGIGNDSQLGLEKATEDFVAYIDSDVIVPKGTLEMMISELKTASYAGIYAQIKAPSTSNYWEWATQQDIHLAYNHPGETKMEIPNMTGLWKRAIITKYGFDPLFTGAYADGDLSYRVRAAGHKLGCSRAFIYHRHRSTLRRIIRQRYWHGKGGARFIWKHRFFLGLLNLFFPVGPLHLARCILKGKPQIIPYVVVRDGAHWSGMVKELARLLWYFARRVEITG